MSEKQVRLLSMALSLGMTLLLLAVVRWTELPPWKRTFYLQRIRLVDVGGAAPTLVADWIDREIEKFRAEMSRWEHGQT